MMIKCPECDCKVSDTARICPGCKGDLAALKKRQSDMKGLVGILLLIAVIIAAIIIVILSPGFLVNWMMGRFKDDPDGFILASAKDWQTWVISLSTWMCLVILGYKIKKTKRI